MQAEMIVLRLIHILGGIFWVGAILFISFFLLPAMQQAGAAAGPVMQGLQQRRVFTIVPIVAVITMLTGFRLMQIVSGGYFTDYFWSSSGQWYAYSSVPVIIGFFVGIMVGRPATMRAQKLSAMAASAENDREKLMGEVRTLQQRAALAMRITAILLLLGATGMALARYL